MKDSVVIIPTYNERGNIEKIIRQIFSLYECITILVVDDGSPDFTASVVKCLKSEFQFRLYLLENDKRYGLGMAYISGFKWALRRNYSYILEMDADFSHNPKDLFRLYEECAKKGIDLAIGSRYLTGVNVINWPISRVLISYMASKYVWFISGLYIHDITSGFKCYKREALKIICPDKVQFKGYTFQIEMKYKAWIYGLILKEIPIIFINRTIGVSKMNRCVFFEAFFGVLWLKLYSLFHKIPTNLKQKRCHDSDT